jgi:hypothetical protein
MGRVSFWSEDGKRSVSGFLGIVRALFDLIWKDGSGLKVCMEVDTLHWAGVVLFFTSPF